MRLNHAVEKQPENHENIFDDLPYDDLDALVRSCGVILPGMPLFP
jgi:hypothetical protein